MENTKNEQQCAIHDVIHRVCPNCNIEMIKLPIEDKHRINWSDKYIIHKRFQYYCTKCEYLSFKHCV